MAPYVTLENTLASGKHSMLEHYKIIIVSLCLCFSAWAENHCWLILVMSLIVAMGVLSGAADALQNPCRLNIPQAL